ncbi:MAG: hypothetical protein H6652_13690 [Ardenticatenaceae bacterium]|nr:hypothetical protein [Ardenticatenaceae bacterium]
MLVAVAVGSRVAVLVGSGVADGSAVGVVVGTAVFVGIGMSVLIGTAVAAISSGLFAVAQAAVSNVNIIVNRMICFFMCFSFGGTAVSSPNGRS